MRRTDRLFRLLLRLRRSRVVTAATLAQELEVSERTIYRDIADLVSSGLPIVGEAGVGYQLRGFDLPPLMFDREQIEAMVLGVRVVQVWGDERLAQAAGEAISKIEAVLPKPLAHLVEETPLYAPSFGERRTARLPLSALREAVRERRLVALSYRDEAGAASERTVRPLGLTFFPPAWLLVAWCELRQDFRSFRLDRMERCKLCAQTFEPEAGKTLEEFVQKMAAEAC